jgi:methionyl-tRNA formyltransferase
MNVAFFGTSAFGAEVLRALVERGRLSITSVVCQPDRPSGRGRELRPQPVAEAALGLGLDLRRPQVASDEPPPADAGVVVAFGQILRDPLLSAYPLVNLHPSALPRWRGAAPIERAIMAGDRETAVDVIAVVAELDAGPVLASRALVIEPDDDAGSLRAKALTAGVPLIEQALLEHPQPRPQAVDGVTYAHKITADDRALDWTRPAAELERRVRALSPHIGARCRIDGRPSLVWRARSGDGGERPGVIRPPLRVACGSGELEILELQPEGKRRMPAADYLRGLQAPPALAT